MNKFLDLEVENACDEVAELGYDLGLVTDAQIASYIRLHWTDLQKDTLDEVTAAVKRLRKRKKGFGK